MATFFRNVLKSSIGITEQLSVTTASNARSTIIGLSLTNMTESSVLANIRLENTVDATSAYYIKGVTIPPNQSLRVVNGGEKLVMANNMNLYISSNSLNSLDAVISYVEIV